MQWHAFHYSAMLRLTQNFHQQTQTVVPRVAKTLGYDGLIPFAVLSTGLWTAPPQYFNQINQALITYAAVILSFMGAVHWGMAIDLANKAQKIRLSLSVTPALIGWLALLLPVNYGYALVIMSFSLLCIVDSLLAKQHATPLWYPSLRIPLTTVVVCSLILALLAS